ncbi:MAG: ABC transporter permease [Dehalococcoidia bacterium]
MMTALFELRRYPSALVGLALILTLTGVAIYGVIAIPYNEALRLWRGGGDIWIEHPRNAQPEWVNLFPGNNLPKTIILSSREGGTKRVQVESGELKSVQISLGFDYRYDDFPSELNLFFDPKFRERPPHVSLFWLTPDGRRLTLGDRSVGPSERYAVSLDQRLARRLDGNPPEVGLFADPAAPTLQPLKGEHTLLVEGLLFEEGADLDVRLVVYGQVHGLAGTDHLRRDITVALLWGTAVALAFGLLAAVGSSICTLVIAAIGVWYGGWADSSIQRVTELNMILPGLPILILVGTLYSRSIWVILGIVILLGIFSASIKVYRAIFLQVRESPYIEASRAYGAGNLRIILLYMVPRVIPVLVPGFVTLIPAFVFLEASLAILGLGDPVLPTWGKVLNDAQQNGALYKGYYYWVLGPAVLLMITGLGFAMIGLSMDRIFNPRLREL